MTTYTVTRSFPLLRARIAGLAAHLTAVPGDEIRSEPDDDGIPRLMLVRGEGGAETEVRATLSEVRPFCREN